MLLRLIGSGTAIKPQREDIKRLEDRHDRRRIRTDEHRTAQLDGDGDHDRQINTSGFIGILTRMQGCFDLQRILTGLQQEDITSAVDQPLGNDPVPFIHLIVVDMPQ